MEEELNDQVPSGAKTEVSGHITPKNAHRTNWQSGLRRLELMQMGEFCTENIDRKEN